MSNSSSYTSLLALVEDHLSKTHIQDQSLEDAANGSVPKFRIPTLNSLKRNTQSETLMSISSRQTLPASTFQLRETPINNTLAVQLSNMLKAKELKRQQEEEKKRLKEENDQKIVREPEDDYTIDLMQALQRNNISSQPVENNAAMLSSSSSFESLFNPEFVDYEARQEKKVSELLPCKTDMSYILHTEVRRGKCSAFGKVLTSRLRRVAAPYLREKIETDIVRFDFSTPSPCDLIKEKLKRPTCHSTYIHGYDIFGIMKD